MIYRPIFRPIYSPTDRPSWLPSGARLHCDFDNGHFYWDGAVRQLADLTEVPGGYTLNALLPGADAHVIVYDYTADVEEPPSGTLLWIGASSGQTYHSVSWQTAGGANTHRLQSTTWAVGTQFANVRLESKPDESVNFPGIGRHRVLMDLVPGELFGWQPDNGMYRKTTLNRTPAALFEIGRIGFGTALAWATGLPQSPAVNQALHCVTIYTAPRSMAQITALGRGRPMNPAPVHLLGDSFLNLYDVLHQFCNIVSAAKYIGLSQDGVGSTNLLEQSARYLSGPGKWRDATLVICDFGHSGIENTASGLGEILTGITHDRWIFLEPAPQAAIGSPSRDEWDTAVAAYRDMCGDHFVPTLEAAYAESDESEADEDEVAKGLWPLSLKKSEADFHPNKEKGAPFIAGIIADALEDRGWA